MRRSGLLLTDALINLLLGLFLIVFPARAVEVLGIPPTDTAFYPSLLGAVLLGIAAALWIESRRKRGRSAGLGLAGAVAINLVGAAAVLGWLASGRLDIPTRGAVLLLVLAVGLIVISLVEAAAVRAERRD